MDERPSVSFTKDFLKNIKQLKKEQPSIKQDLAPLIEELETGNTPGVQIKGVGFTVYKVRLKNSDKRKGKRGGYRVIYYIRTPVSIVLLAIYSKLEKADITKNEISLIISRFSTSSE